MLSVEEIMRRIKNAVDSKSSGDGTGFIDFTKTEEQVEIKNQTLNMNDIYQYIVKSNESWKVNYHLPITSHRKIIGKAIVFAKKAIRTLLSWYINPIVEQQISFNSNVVNSLNRIADALEIHSKAANISVSNNVKVIEENIRIKKEKLWEELKDYLEKRISDLDIHVRNNIEKTQMDLHDYIAVAQTDCNQQIEQMKYELKNYLIEQSFKKLSEIDSALGYNQRARLELMESVKISEDLVNLELYRKIFSLKNGNQKLRNNHGNILILCKDFARDNTNEAIKKEAFTYFRKLLANGRDVKFISFEESVNELTYEKDKGIYYCPYVNCYNEIKKLNPYILHFYENSPNLLFLDDMKLMEFKVIYTLTGINPIFGFDARQLEELLHQCEMQKVIFITECEHARKIMNEKGFKTSSVIAPISEISKETTFHSERSHIPFTVGFASSPIIEEHYEARGVDLFIEAASKLPEVNFIIAWRNKGIEIKNYVNKSNISIKYGIIDMDKLYDECDIIILPFTERKNAHAFPLSALEMLIKGKPVISTFYSGISEFISENNLGIVCDANSEDLCRAISDCTNNYDNYLQNITSNTSKINNKVNYLQAYVNVYQRSINSEVIPLFMWRQTLKESNNQLIKGLDNMKLYYQDNEIAAKYTDNRFKSFPMNCYNIEECESVKILINEAFNSHNLKLLDIACGEGRILKELIPYGECFGIDSSASMLIVALDKISKQYNNPNLQLISRDFFNHDINDHFNIITMFRYIRHFEYPLRQIIYKKIYRLLNEDGMLILDVPNINAESLLRKHIGWNKFNIYDVFWTEQSIEEELKDNGFELVRKINIGEGLIDNIPGLEMNIPLSWVVAAQKSRN